MKGFLDPSRGEHGRIDWIVDEHEKLERRYQALVELLIAKRVITKDEVGRLGLDGANV